VPAVSLPVNLNPPYKTWQCFGAHPLSVLGGASDLTPLLASEYINLACLKTPVDGMVSAAIVPRRSIGHFVLSGHCELFDLEERWHLEVTDSRRLIQGLLEAMSDGWYILLHLNKYYMPSHICYLTQDFLHDCLVIGFDTGRQIFEVLMYVSTGQYGVSEVPFANLAMAMAFRGGKYFLDDSICYASIVLAVRPKRGIRFQFAREVARNHLHDYLNSVQPDIELYARDNLKYAGDWFMAYGCDSKLHCYGLRAFVRIISHVRTRVDQHQRIDSRDTRALWERKTIMLGNMGFWKKHTHVSNIEELIDLYAEVVKWVRDLHVMCFTYNQRHQPSQELVQWFDRFGSIIEVEKEILARMALGLRSG
jgi:hypothetical protein